MDKKNILTKIKELFNSTSELFEGMDYKTQDGRILRVVGSMEVGTEVKEITEEGEMDVEDGEYLLEDGITLEIKEGKITNIMEVETEMVETEPTDKEEMTETEPTELEGEYKGEIDTKLIDGTEIRIITKGEEVSIGDMVLVKVGEGYNEAPEGRHELEGGLVVYTDKDGYINEIETKETEVKEEETMNELFSSIKLLVDEVKDLKDTIKSLQVENKELKSNFNKFSKQPSEEPTKHEVKFSKMDKDEKIKFFSKK